MSIRGYNYVISRLKKSRGGFDTLQASLEKLLVVLKQNPTMMTDTGKSI